MATYQFSALADGQAIAFSPTADVLNFDQSVIAAADIRVTASGSNTRIEVITGAHAGKDITLLNTTPLQLALTNVTFVNGSRLVMGDGTTATASDNAANTLTGTAGRDHLEGLGGVDTMNGGAGDDVYYVTSGDIISDTGGTDTVYSQVSFSLSLNSGVENLTMLGTAVGTSLMGNQLNNVLTGSEASNASINGRAGNDTMYGLGGNDTFDMSTGGTSSYGNDVIDGGTGVDTIDFGANARSALNINLTSGSISGGGDGGVGTVAIVNVENATGGAFADLMIGNASANSLFGGAANDTLDGGAGADRLEGGTEADHYRFSVAPGSANADTIVGFSSGSDKIVLDASVFSSLGAPGNFAAADSRFAAGAGFNSGRDSSDRVIYNTSTGQLWYDADGSGSGAAQLIATLQGFPAFAATDVVVQGTGGPTSGNDSLTGTNGDDTIDGLAGNDTIVGLGGNDSLLGGAGNDVFRPGGVSDPGTDVINGGDGIDTVDYSDARSAIRGSMWEGGLNGGGDGGAGHLAPTWFVENFIGGAFDDFLDGNDLANRLEGGGGNDTLAGETGTDTLVGGAGSDVFQLQGPNTADVIADFASGADKLQVSGFSLANIGPSGNFAAGDARFWAAAGANSGHDSDDRIVYNTSTGQLWYDADGSGNAAAQLIATLQGAPSLAATDIAVDGPSGPLRRTIMDNGPTANRVDIVILGDGYTAADIAAGTLDAHVNSLLDYLFDGSLLTQPFGRYESFFNVHLIQIESNESGADHPQAGITRDTALDATYGVGANARLLTINTADASTLMANALSGSGISPEMRFVTVNDATYGGSGGTFGVYAGANADAHELAMHEIAHSFANLGDHYGEGFGRWSFGEPGHPDLTIDSSGAKWSQWLGYDQPGVGVIGAYEGGARYDTGIWHPSLNSKMKSLGQPFDAVGREQFVLDFYDLVDPLDGHSPNAGVQRNVDLFTIDTIDPSVILADWTVNDATFANRGEQISLAGLGFTGGDFTVTARAYDPTDWVRLSRTSLEETISWSVINDGARVGGPGNDVLFVGSGNDTLDAGGGNDTLRGGAGNDSLIGGSGSDHFVIAHVGSPNADRIADFSSGFDQLRLDAGVMTALGASGNFAAGDERFHAGAAAAEVDDRVVWNAATGELWYDADGSSSGQASLIATMQAGATVVATDIAVDNGTPPSTGGQTISGTAGNDSLSGTDGNDTLDGLGGNDTLNGGLGDDKYIAQSGDVLIDSGGIDTLETPSAWNLTASAIDNVTLIGTASVGIQFNNLDNRITGNSANNSLEGRGGNDTIAGGGGNDYFKMITGPAGFGADVLDGGEGIDMVDYTGTALSALNADLAAGTVTGGDSGGGGGATIASIEKFGGGNFNDRISGNAANNQLIGNGGNDTLIGLAGGDSLSGGDGNDWLEGGIGFDTLVGGVGADSFAFNVAPGSANADRVTDFATGVDQLLIENAVYIGLGAPSDWAAGDGRFRSAAGATAAADADDRLIYNSTNGNLYYDADGVGGAASQLVATLANLPALSAADITVI